jgi:hypothetical protein
MKFLRVTILLLLFGLPVPVLAQISVTASETGNTLLTPGGSATARGVNWEEFRPGGVWRWSQGFNAVMLNYIYECRVVYVDSERLVFYVPIQVQEPPSVFVFNGDVTTYVVPVTVTPSNPSLLSEAGAVTGLYTIPNSGQVRLIAGGVVTRLLGQAPSVSLFASGLGTVAPPYSITLDPVPGPGIGGDFLAALSTSSNLMLGHEALTFTLFGILPAGEYRARIRNRVSGRVSDPLKFVIVDVAAGPTLPTTGPTAPTPGPTQLPKKPGWFRPGKQ